MKHIMVSVLTIEEAYKRLAEKAAKNIKDAHVDILTDMIDTGRMPNFRTMSKDDLVQALACLFDDKNKDKPIQWEVNKNGQYFHWAVDMIVLECEDGSSIPIWTRNIAEK
jgi:hypothetical protein